MSCTEDRLIFWTQDDVVMVIKFIKEWDHLGVASQLFPPYIKRCLETLLPQEEHNTHMTLGISPPEEMNLIALYRCLEKAFVIMVSVIKLQGHVKHGRLVAACLLSRIEDLVHMDIDDTIWREKSLTLQFLFLANIMEMGDGIVIPKFNPESGKFATWNKPISDFMTYIWRSKGPRIQCIEARKQFQPPATLHAHLLLHMSGMDGTSLKEFPFLAFSLAREWFLQEYKIRFTTLKAWIRDKTSYFPSEDKNIINLTQDKKDLQSASNLLKDPDLQEHVHQDQLRPQERSYPSQESHNIHPGIKSPHLQGFKPGFGVYPGSVSFPKLHTSTNVSGLVGSSQFPVV